MLLISMAEKILRSRIKFASTLKSELFEKLKDYSELTDIPTYRILDRYVGQYFDDLEKKHKQGKSPVE